MVLEYNISYECDICEKKLIVNDPAVELESGWTLGLTFDLCPECLSKPASSPFLGREDAAIKKITGYESFKIKETEESADTPKTATCPACKSANVKSSESDFDYSLDCFDCGEIWAMPKESLEVIQ
jgi:hypothetical protein